jgi:sugar-specific transcriptional regulator TrmB/DNA-binding CsgD family transcriptional regulator
LLEELGIEPDDEELYECVLRQTNPTVSDLVTRLRRPAAEIRAGLATLAEHGLVSCLAGTPKRWVAPPPDVAIGVLIQQRERRLRSLQRMVRHYVNAYQRGEAAADASNHLVETLHGRDVISERVEQLHAQARQQVCVFDKPPRVEEQPGPAQHRALRRGVVYRTVYERASLDAPGRLEEVRRGVEAGEEARVLPQLPVKLLLVDRRWAMVPISAGVADHALVVRSSGLLDGLVSLFEQQWQRALPLFGAAGSDDAGDLLTMLLTGMTDETIARRLGIGLRTVQRRVRALMDELGADTRFQAGFQAARAAGLADRAGGLVERVPEG